MYEFFKRNNKKLFAVFAAFLMIVFLLPSTMGQLNHYDPLAGRVAGKKVFHSKIGNFAEQGNQLIQILQGRGGSTQETQYALSRVFPLPLAMLVRDHPEAMYLLSLEADEMGIHVSTLDVQQAYDSLKLGNIDRDTRAFILAGLETSLKIRSAFDRVGSAVKVSTPIIDHARAEQFQRITLNLVEFKSDDLLATLPTPGDDLLQKQFDTYADVLAGSAGEKTEPYGFGYKFPDRARFQWIAVPRTETILAARKSKTDYEWTVEAQKEYIRNPHRYPATQPTTKAGEFVTGLEPAATQPAGATTRPFEEVREQIVDSLAVTQADTLRTQVLNKISAILNADWLAFQKDPAKPSSLGVAYDTFAYLDKIRDAVQTEFGLGITVESVGKLLSAEEMNGTARLSIAGAMLNKQQSFSEYLFGSAEAFIPVDQRGERFGLSAYQPSSTLRDDLRGDVFVFRITEASATHKPANLAEVREQVEKDVKRKLAYEQTELAAKTLMEKARTTDLRGAAAESMKPLITTNSFEKGRQTQFGPMPPNITGYTVPDGAVDAFVDQSFKLLRSATESSPKSKGLISLPRAGVALAAELEGVQSILPETMTFMVDLNLARQSQYEQVGVLLEKWFNWDNIAARTKWEPAEKPKPDHSPQPQRPQNMPIGR